MEQPLVTIVTVTYNSSAYVRDAIDSVLAQEYQNIEYIIGDDCSLDNTWEIIREYQDPRIYTYRNEQNLGEYPNRNKAIEQARGKYLIFIDGDDIIFRHGIGFFVSMMEAFPEGGMAIQKNYHNNILYPALFSSEETLLNYFYGSVNLLTSSFASDFFKTSILQQWKLSTQYVTGDEEIRLKIAMHYPILFVAGWVSWPRETPGQASSMMGKGKGIIEAYQYTNEILSTNRNPQIDPRLLDEMICILKKRMARVIWYFFYKGNFGMLKLIFSQTGFSWKEMLKYFNFKPEFKDNLVNFSPARPFKKGFLNKLPAK